MEILWSTHHSKYLWLKALQNAQGAFFKAVVNEAWTTDTSASMLNGRFVFSSPSLGNVPYGFHRLSPMSHLNIRSQNQLQPCQKWQFRLHKHWLQKWKMRMIFLVLLFFNLLLANSVGGMPCWSINTSHSLTVFVSCQFINPVKTADKCYSSKKVL